MTRIIRRSALKSAPITTTLSGIATFRTRRPLTEAKAVRFASLLVANPRFLDATVVPSRKANHFHVCFVPNSADRIAAMLDMEDAKDRAAMLRDGRNFRYAPIANPTELRGFSDVWECAGIGGNYETTLSGGGSCSCPHYKYRRSVSGGECKHIKELARRKESGLLTGTKPAPVKSVYSAYVPAVAPVESFTARHRDADFG